MTQAAADTRNAAATAPLTVRAMGDADGRAVGALHALTINRGFLAKLGPRFLSQLYRGIACDGDSAVWVVEAEGRVLGFLAYTKNVAGLYSRILKARLVPLGWSMLPRILYPSFLKHAYETWRYPAKQSEMNLPPAELLAVGVHPSLQGRGAGRKLLAPMLERARKDGVEVIKVVAGAELDSANAFYLGCGFTKLTQFDHHGKLSNVYVMNVQSAG